jgi:hypothetical protein
MFKLLVSVIESWCECHGWQRQADFIFPDGERLRIMQTSKGYCVQVGKPSKYPPSPIPGEEVIHEIERQRGKR